MLYIDLRKRSQEFRRHSKSAIRRFCDIIGTLEIATFDSKYGAGGGEAILGLHASCAKPYTL